MYVNKHVNNACKHIIVLYASSYRYVYAHIICMYISVKIVGCYSIMITQHSIIVITEPYSVDAPDLSISFKQLSICSRGISTAMGWLSSKILPS